MGPFWSVLAPVWPILTSRGTFWPILAIMWPPTSATQELGAQTHGDRVALHRGTFVLGLRPFWGYVGPFGAVLASGGLWPHFGLLGPILAIFSSDVAADRRHPGVGGPNLVGRTALGRGPFGLSLGPQAIGVPRISKKSPPAIACCLLLVACCCRC